MKAVLSNEEFDEVMHKYRFFWKEYNLEREVFFSAFLNRHGNYFVPERKADKQEGGGGYGGFGAGDAEEVMHHKVEVLTSRDLKRVSVIMSALKPLTYLKKSQEKFVQYFKKLGRGE